MARETKAALLERATRAEREKDILGHGLHCALHSTPDAEISWPYDDEARFIARLYKARAPHGGILLLTFDCEGQRPLTRAVYFDEWYQSARHGWRHGDHGTAQAAERLNAARRDILSPPVSETLPS